MYPIFKLATRENSFALSVTKIITPVEMAGYKVLKEG